jgi:hypothetical protein
MFFGRSFSMAQSAAVSVAGALLTLLVYKGWRLWLSRRVPPEELERRRRRMLVDQGKMADATLVELREDYIFYTYDVRGVEYTASQDVSALKHLVPDAPEWVAMPVAVRYDPRNAANSIILAEDWNGLRMLHPHT